MGRTSKRHTAGMGAQRSTAGTAGQKGEYFRAGIYARLSADLDKKFCGQTNACEQALKNKSNALKSESLEVQIEIARKFVEEWNRSGNERIEVAGCYTDLGKTGTNFNRDGFMRLMQDVRLGYINCVIVKDLSRFGRNYLEAGNYIEKIFPFLGVRFIAVADGYDTGVYGSGAKQMMLEIKNLVNDMYARDFSLKAKASLAQRRKEGAYVGGLAPYGYRAGRDGRLRKLTPDENTAELVRYIFEKFIETESYTAVSDDLNVRRINPPAVYRKTGEVYCPPEADFKGWDKGAVERIVKSDTYLGRLVQGKTSITARNEKNRFHKPEDDWVVTEKAHEPLIGSQTAEAAAAARRKLRERTKSHKHPAAGCSIGENIFDKVLYCGVCGRKMTRHSYVKDYKDGTRKRMGGYFCLNGGSTKADACPSSNRISNMELNSILFQLLKMELAKNLKKQRTYVETAEMIVSRKKEEVEKKLRFAVYARKRMDEEENSKYVAFRRGELSQKEYADYKMRKEDRARELEKQESRFKEQLDSLKRDGATYLKAVRALIKWKQSISSKDKPVLTGELIETLIEKIYVHPGKRVEVLFTYSDALMENAGETSGRAAPLNEKTGSSMVDVGKDGGAGGVE